MTREEAAREIESHAKHGVGTGLFGLPEAFTAAVTALRGPEWVRTVDRLPERMKLLPCSVRVLISCAIGVVSAQYDFQDNVWVDNFNHKHSPWSKINVYDQSMQVTHWMPLPEPPGGEGER